MQHRHGKIFSIDPNPSIIAVLSPARGRPKLLGLETWLRRDRPRILALTPTLRISSGNVDEHFLMSVPIYLELGRLTKNL